MPYKFYCLCGTVEIFASLRCQRQFARKSLNVLSARTPKVLKNQRVFGTPKSADFARGNPFAHLPIKLHSAHLMTLTLHFQQSRPVPRNYNTNPANTLNRIRPRNRKLTAPHTRVACFLNSTSIAVLNIRPPSIGPTGTRLNSPIPILSRNS